MALSCGATGPGSWWRCPVAAGQGRRQRRGWAVARARDDGPGSRRREQGLHRVCLEARPVRRHASADGRKCARRGPEPAADAGPGACLCAAGRRVRGGVVRCRDIPGLALRERDDTAGAPATGAGMVVKAGGAGTDRCADGRVARTARRIARVVQDPAGGIDARRYGGKAVRGALPGPVAGAGELGFGPGRGGDMDDGGAMTVHGGTLASGRRCSALAMPARAAHAQ